jgi:hypothetical protein
MLRAVKGIVREKTSATPAAARRSAACMALREHRLAWNARGGLADREAIWRPRGPLAPMLVDEALASKPRAAL